MGGKPSKDETLNDKEIKLLKETWKIILDYGISKCGIGIMTRVQLEHKELKSLWRKKRAENDENSAETYNPNIAIKVHGEKLLNLIDTAMESLNELDKVAQIFRKSGYDHDKYGVKIEHYKVSKFLISLFQF
jgi:hypothetical protein